MTIVSRNGRLHLRKRVPRRYRPVEPRTTLWISLHTDSMEIAREKAARVWRQNVEAWEARLAGDTSDAERRFQAARSLAQARGVRYLPADRVADLPLDDLLARLEGAFVKGKLDRKEADALLGLAPRPSLRISGVLDSFWPLVEHREQGQSPAQVHRGRLQRKLTFSYFQQIAGDRDVMELTREDLLDYRQWLWERIRAGEMQRRTANKYLSYLASTFREIEKRRRLGITLDFADLQFDDAEKNSRPPFSTEWIRDRLLAPDAMAGLNAEARCILLGMVNTGYRPSEGVDLRPEHIRLDTNIPHISIEPVGRKLKTAYSERKIPLAGISLEAFRACPEGFPRYRDKTSSWSALVNKFMRVNGLAETPDHTAYSLRHSFEDRMLAAGVDERIRRDIMGHTLNRERYGKGASLAQLAEIIQGIAV